MHLRLRLNDASSRRSPKKFESAIKTLLSSPSPTFELSHVHLQPSSSLISISDVDLEISLLRRRLSRALSSLKLITSSLISDGYYELSHLCLSRALLSPPIWVSNIVEVWSSKLLSLELALHRLHRSQALSISLISASLSSLQVSGSQGQTLYKLTLSMTIDTWKSEETRYFFGLYAEERRKRNKVGTSMNKVGKTNIMESFEQRFKKNFPDWRPYKSNYDTSRKKYIKIKTLTQNRTGLGFDDMGRIDMSDDWWSERERECPGIRRSVCKEISNMDMFEAEFGGVVVTGAEGWSAQHGEASLNSRVGEDDGDDEADSQPAAETQALETETHPQAPRQTQPSTQTHSGSSRAKRRRKEKDMVVEACVKRTETLEVKNKIAERMLE
ncbi:unnamed protein product, partial [Brassica oleracea]